jgi:hypothetical protein
LDDTIRREYAALRCCCKVTEMRLTMVSWNCRDSRRRNIDGVDTRGQIVLMIRYRMEIPPEGVEPDYCHFDLAEFSTRGDWTWYTSPFLSEWLPGTDVDLERSGLEQAVDERPPGDPDPQTYVPPWTIVWHGDTRMGGRPSQNEEFRRAQRATGCPGSGTFFVEDFPRGWSRNNLTYQRWIVWDSCPPYGSHNRRSAFWSGVGGVCGSWPVAGSSLDHDAGMDPILSGLEGLPPALFPAPPPYFGSSD